MSELSNTSSLQLKWTTAIFAFGLWGVAYISAGDNSILSYDAYTAIHWAATILALVITAFYIEAKQYACVALMLLVALVFNPFVEPQFTRIVWSIVDVAAGIIATSCAAASGHGV